MPGRRLSSPSKQMKVAWPPSEEEVVRGRTRAGKRVSYSIWTAGPPKFVTWRREEPREEEEEEEEVEKEEKIFSDALPPPLPIQEEYEPSPSPHPLPSSPAKLDTILLQLEHLQSTLNTRLSMLPPPNDVLAIEPPSAISTPRKRGASLPSLQDGSPLFGDSAVLDSPHVSPSKHTTILQEEQQQHAFQQPLMERFRVLREQLYA
eukprot:TRINITY_DN3696_c0_g1_i1.p1 TRINITY_DN3696_c0_g1~~TRINITY_DN3696_c0_g1_i1.p1  ORF type:complete len:235 (+),score=32.29 TRINITY_DN3696_c0_g1_i1:93-707(+)